MLASEKRWITSVGVLQRLLDHLNSGEFINSPYKDQGPWEFFHPNNWSLL
ncbi:Uncharacterised protein [Legionella gratiana]|uniref:Uncharacterized protein n=1 Tax=Legionella gratiana TaxID=45066 RepID=A0A378JP78_9GAMM|nr:Uncharacterised protein [Legionella gratiana]